MWFFLILGAIVFLMMEHALVFWIVFVPLALMFIVFLVKWLKGEGGDNALASVFALIAMVVALMIVCIPS